MIGINFANADLRWANLARSRFIGGRLALREYSNLTESNLYLANMSEAWLGGTAFDAHDVKGAGNSTNKSTKAIRFYDRLLLILSN